MTAQPGGRLPAPPHLAPLQDLLNTDRLRTTSGTAFGRLVAETVEGVRVAQRDDGWKRFKVCRRGTCRWAFDDHPRNNSSRWCASSICGAREKSRRAYRRGVQPLVD